jgi:hypothetical protein
MNQCASRFVPTGTHLSFGSALREFTHGLTPNALPLWDCEDSQVIGGLNEP